MLYLIGLGLNEKGYSREAYDSISKADRIYFDSYTVDFPYKIKDLEKQFSKKKFLPADRELIESFGILDEAKNKKIVLLVYGSPLTATTHISLIQEAKKRKIKYRVIHGASVLDAVLETGLQVYKFGKIASMPSWIPEKN
ncbi:MAG TPA: SAM-dependent methyltransferase, partial [Candidatus Nanoarchaeia archaeon]|nr:SAM-dependent methyltransferase [Candidatus Nanoarchaeia archaeon]